MTCTEVKEIIQLYLDDELAARDTLDVQKHLESCSGCTHVLEAFLEQDRLLREEARAEQIDSHLLREQILSAIRGDRAQQPRIRLSARDAWSVQPAWRRVAAIAVLAITAALLLAKAGFLPGITENVYAAVASDHADHCAFDSRVPAITDGEELDRMSRSLGKLDRTPDLSAFGYSNVKGRTCEVNSTAFLHLVYYSPDQRPVSVFLRLHSHGPNADDLKVVRAKEYEVASVSKLGVDLLVVSSKGNRQGAAIAESIAAQLQR